MPKFVKDIVMADTATIKGLPAPSDSSDAATKAYVDSKVSPVASVNTKTGAVVLNAVDIAVADNDGNFTNTNVETVLAELKQFANSGKNSIAGVIGSPAASSDTFAQLTEHIQTAKNALATLINRAEGNVLATQALQTLTNALPNIRALKKKVRFLKEAGPDTLVFKEYNGSRPTQENLCFTFFTPKGTAQTEVVAEFNNGEETNFEPNPYIVFASGLGQLKNSYDYSATSEPDGIKQFIFDASQFETISNMAINAGTTLLSLTAQPVGQVLIPTGNISIPQSTVTEIRSINQTLQIVGGESSVKYAISFDSGARWYSKISNDWVKINTDSNAPTATQISTDGMTPSTVGGLNVFDIETLRTLEGNNPDTIKFAYYIKDTSLAEKAKIDAVSLYVRMNGTFSPMVRGNIGEGNHNDVTFSGYDSTTGTLSFTYLSANAYMITYLDAP